MSTHKPSTTSPSLSNSTSEPAEHTHSTVNELAQSLNKIISEGRNPDSLNIDTLSTVGILRCINNEDAKEGLLIINQDSLTINQNTLSMYKELLH